MRMNARPTLESPHSSAVLPQKPGAAHRGLTVLGKPIADHDHQLGERRQFAISRHGWTGQQMGTEILARSSIAASRWFLKMRRY